MTDTETKSLLDFDPPLDDDGNAVIAFEHSFFGSVEGAYFRFSEQMDEPVFVVQMGDNEVTLPFPGIKREFGLAADSVDAKLLDLLAEGLAYVKILHLGDPIPKEVLTGEASWEVTAKHRMVAYQRLTMQMVTWLSGDEISITNPDELAQVADDPKTKEKVRAAFREAAAQLGFDGDGDESGEEKILALIEGLAEEFAYIEALRDRHQNVIMMNEKILGLRKLYAHELSVFEIVDSVARLMQLAVKDYQNILDQVDAQTGEIMAVLRNIDAQVKFVHELRDDLYRRLVSWDEMFVAWMPATVIRSESNEVLLRQTYRFLAPRFIQGDNWTLLNQLLDKKTERKTEMVW